MWSVSAAIGSAFLVWLGARAPLQRLWHVFRRHLRPWIPRGRLVAVFERLVRRCLSNVPTRVPQTFGAIDVDAVCLLNSRFGGRRIRIDPEFDKALLVISFVVGLSTA